MAVGNPLVWRSLLFVPANVEKYIEKAHTRRADVIQLDLEDSVPASQKKDARVEVKESAAKVSRNGADVVVRINRGLRQCILDLEASICPRVRAVAVAKTESAAHLRLLSEVMDELERDQGMAVGSTGLIAMVETADAYYQMREIAKASSRVVALTVGAEDFAESCGMVPDPDSLYLPKVQSVIASRSAGISPLGLVGSLANFSDLENFQKMARRSRQIGFEGASCIHPNQVGILNDVFRPSEEEVIHARRIVEEHDKASVAGRGSLEVEGIMVDAPVVKRAQALLSRHQIIVDREQKRTDESA